MINLVIPLAYLLVCEDPEYCQKYCERKEEVALQNSLLVKFSNMMVSIALQIH